MLIARCSDLTDFELWLFCGFAAATIQVCIMAPTSFDYQWMYEVVLERVSEGNAEFEGNFVEKVLSFLKSFLLLQMEVNQTFSDFCWCRACDVTYLGGIVHHHPSEDSCSIFFAVGGRAFCGASPSDMPVFLELGDDVKLHLKTSFAELGFSLEVDCITHTNAFEHI